MSFDLQCAVACAAGDTATQILAIARAIRFVRAYPIDAPFVGVVAAYDPYEAQDTVYDEAIAAGASEDDASEAGAQALWESLVPLTAAFPHVRFALIHVSCFGGTCLYGGSTTGPGEHVQVPPSHDGHQRLLTALGAVDPPWYFAPFTRGFFEQGAPPAGPPRREVRCSVAGALCGAALVAVALLTPPWRVASASERHAIVVFGNDDLWLSLNLAEDGLDLRVIRTPRLRAPVRPRPAAEAAGYRNQALRPQGFALVARPFMGRATGASWRGVRMSSHLDAEATAARITELVDDLAGHGELVLRDAAGLMLRRWSV